MTWDCLAVDLRGSVPSHPIFLSDLGGLPPLGLLNVMGYAFSLSLPRLAAMVSTCALAFLVLPVTVAGMGSSLGLLCMYLFMIDWILTWYCLCAVVCGSSACCYWLLGYLSGIVVWLCWYLSCLSNCCINFTLAMPSPSQSASPSHAPLSPYSASPCSLPAATSAASAPLGPHPGSATSGLDGAPFPSFPAAVRLGVESHLSGGSSPPDLARDRPASSGPPSPLPGWIIHPPRGRFHLVLLLIRPSRRHWLLPCLSYPSFACWPNCGVTLFLCLSLFLKLNWIGNMLTGLLTTSIWGMVGSSWSSLLLLTEIMCGWIGLGLWKVWIWSVFMDPFLWPLHFLYHPYWPMGSHLLLALGVLGWDHSYFLASTYWFSYSSWSKHTSQKERSVCASLCPCWCH